MGDSLAQFLVWWDSPDGKERAVAEQESTYRIAQRAFEAGQQTQPPEPLRPSRDALSDKHRRIMAKYRPPQPLLDVKTPEQRGLEPDYVQKGTVTGRFTSEPDLKPLARPVFTPHEGEMVRFIGPRPFVHIYPHAPETFEHVETAWNGPEPPWEPLDTMRFRAIDSDEDDLGPRGPVVTPLLGSEDL